MGLGPNGMKSDQEKWEFVAKFISAHITATPQDVEQDLVNYCASGDVPYIMTDQKRQATLKQLNAIATQDSQYSALAKHLSTCITQHPHISGTYGVGTHADTNKAYLNDSMVDTIGSIAHILDALCAHG